MDGSWIFQSRDDNHGSNINGNLSHTVVDDVEVKFTYPNKEFFSANFCKMLKMKIPEDFDYKAIPGLSNEVIEKLEKFNPPTLFNASEISGITPSAIDIIHMYINVKNKK